jgi:hypothetical protein
MCWGERRWGRWRAPSIWSEALQPAATHVPPQWRVRHTQESHNCTPCTCTRTAQSASVPLATLMRCGTDFACASLNREHHVVCSSSCQSTWSEQFDLKRPATGVQQLKGLWVYCRRFPCPSVAPRQRSRSCAEWCAGTGQCLLPPAGSALQGLCHQQMAAGKGRGAPACYATSAAALLAFVHLWPACLALVQPKAVQTRQVITA